MSSNSFWHLLVWYFYLANVLPDICLRFHNEDEVSKILDCKSYLHLYFDQDFHIHFAHFENCLAFNWFMLTFEACSELIQLFNIHEISQNGLDFHLATFEFPFLQKRIFTLHTMYVTYCYIEKLISIDVVGDSSTVLKESNCTFPWTPMHFNRKKVNEIMPWTSQIKYNWRLCKTNFEREAEQLRQWRHWRNGRIRANAFLSWSPHPGTIGLPLFFRRVLFPSFFIFTAAGKVKYQMGNSRQMSYLYV